MSGERPAEEGRAPPSEPAVAELEARLGTRLHDATLALAALTHKSYVNEHRGEGLADNERLEFLGDAVIDLAVSQRLMERFPDAREGDLSKIRASLVDEPALARLARALDLGPLLRLGRGEELTGGREKASLLADAFEAVVAVVFLGGGLESVLRVIDRFLPEAFERAAAGTLDRDYKTQLQELAQSRYRAAPRYRVVGEAGPDHEKIFDVELELRGEVLGRGSGRSKKDAEQEAARTALEQLGPRLAEEGAAPLLAPTLTPVPEAPPVPAPVPSPTPAPTAPAAAPSAGRGPAGPTPIGRGPSRRPARKHRRVAAPRRRKSAGRPARPRRARAKGKRRR